MGKFFNNKHTGAESIELSLPARPPKPVIDNEHNQSGNVDEPATAIATTPASSTESALLSTSDPTQAVLTDAKNYIQGCLTAKFSEKQLDELRNLLNSGELTTGKLSLLNRDRDQSSASTSGGLVYHPDGSISVTITLPVETVEPLTVWAEAAEISLQEQIQMIASQSLENYIFGQWLPAPTTPAASTRASAATPTATPQAQAAAQVPPPATPPAAASK